MMYIMIMINMIMILYDSLFDDIYIYKNYMYILKHIQFDMYIKR
jgi:hypothetical protein